jgi:diguanylate cyclase (GGDEF)-like protein/PAS domain S-box-containing protein
VATVVAGAAVALVSAGPRAIPDVPRFVMLLATSALASALTLRLPVGASSLSVSYAVDFASLLLIGTGPTMIVAGVSAAVQSVFSGAARTPASRVVFNVSALVLTIVAAGAAYAGFGGAPGETDLRRLTTPLLAAAMVYYLANTALVATAVALTSGRRPWHVWHTSFLWTAPNYFVGASAAGVGVILLESGQGWLLPLALAPVYLTFRSYRQYVERMAAEARHNEEVRRLHENAVTALDAARRSEQRYALAAAGSNDGLWDWDITADKLYCSERWKIMIGLPADTHVSTLDHWLQYVHAEDRAGLRRALDAHLAGKTPHFEHEYRMYHTSGDIRAVRCRGTAVRDADGRPTRMAGSQTDITESRRVQETLARAARHDPLTGLPNRTLFSELLQRAITHTPPALKSSYAVLFIDLDGFKLVNDSLGHLIGDQFLFAIAHRLQAQLRPGDVLARLGGDEFAVLVRNFNVPQDVVAVTERLLHAIGTPFNLQGHELYGSASIGVVIGGPQYQSVDALLRDADIAMYRAKASGRGGYELFDPAMHTLALRRLTIETELRRAVERREFVVFYQPIVELPSQRIRGVEALVRWKRPDGSVAEPAEFIPVAEETGLIVPLTYIVLREACGQVAAWQEAFDRPLHLTVNISTKLFGRTDFTAEIERAVQTPGLRPGSLRLEVTESVLLNKSDVVDDNFKRLQRMAVGVYLDDFGTGYSSLSFLQRFPVDALKLDKSFVARMGVPGVDSRIGNAIVTLARELGMDLIAEGVETADQSRHLLSLGCPHAQGYFYSRPLPAAEFLALLTREGAFSAAAAAAWPTAVPVAGRRGFVVGAS